MNYGIGNVKGKSGDIGFSVIEISLAQIDDDNVNFTEEQFNQIMACGNFTLKLPDGTFYNFVGFNNSLQASVFFYAIQDNQTTTPTELTITQLSIVKSTYVGTISPNTYTNGGGGSGTPLYLHNLSWGLDNNGLRTNLHGLFIINDSPDPFTFNSLIQWLSSNGFSQTSSSDYTHRYSVGAYGNRAYSDGSYNFLGITKTYNSDSIIMILRNTSYNGTIVASTFTADGYKEDIIPLATMVAPTPVSSYKHHITIEKYTSSTNYVSILLTITNSSNTPLTINDVMSYLSTNFVYSSSGTDIRHRSGYIASGSQRTTSSDAWTIESVFYKDSTTLYYKGTGKGATNGNTLALTDITTFEDIVIAQ